MKKTHVIIGTSAAGISAAQKLRQLDAACEIICISDEAELPYNKCHLADYVAGSKQEAQLSTLTAESAKQKNIALHLGTRVASLQPSAKSITLSDGQKISYDSLLLALGSSPIMPNISGISLTGVFAFHSLHDIAHIQKFCDQNSVQNVVVIGAGLTGLECADAFAARGLRVTVVERQEHVLPAFINAPAAELIHQKMAAHNIGLHTNQSVVEIVGDSVARGVRLSDGSVLEADMVVVAIGVRGNAQLVREAGIVCEEQGIAINHHMQTSDPSIFAAGDICMVKDLLSGVLVPSRTWPDAMFQGLMAAYAMSGQAREYPGMNVVISSHFFDIKFASCGPVLKQPVECDRVERTGDDYYHLYLVANGRLKGFLLVGNTALLPKLRQAVMQQTPFSIDSI